MKEMKYINKYENFSKKIEIKNNENYLIESIEDYEILMELIEEGIFSKIGNWMFTAPKIRKIMKKVNALRLEAAQNTDAARRKVREMILANEYFDISKLDQIIKKKNDPILDTANEMEKDAQQIAGTNVYLRKVFRGEQLKGIKDANALKTDTATDDEKFAYGNFDKMADGQIKKDYKDVNDATRGRTSGNPEDYNRYEKNISPILLKLDELMKDKPGEVSSVLQNVYNSLHRERSSERKSQIGSDPYKHSQRWIDLQQKYGFTAIEAFSFVDMEDDLKLLDSNIKEREVKEVWDRYNSLIGDAALALRESDNYKVFLNKCVNHLIISRTYKLSLNDAAEAEKFYKEHKEDYETMQAAIDAWKEESK